MRSYATALALAFTAMTGAKAEDQPVFVPGPHGGGAVYVNERHQEGNDSWGYAGAYRAGDYVYLSGVVSGAYEGEPMDAKAFKENLRRTFEHAGETLEAAGASLEEVVDITSFHVWDSPLFEGGKLEHLRAVADVKKEFMPAPHPAWTAIGVSELLPDAGLVELRMVAYAPEDDE